jgi:hypothetical protein
LVGGSGRGDVQTQSNYLEPRTLLKMQPRNNGLLVNSAVRAQVPSNVEHGF